MHRFSWSISTFSLVRVRNSFQVDFSQAKNEQKRRRPIIDSAAQDSDGNYFDQLALDSVSHTSTNVVTAPENYPSRYHSGKGNFIVA